MSFDKEMDKWGKDEINKVENLAKDTINNAFDHALNASPHPGRSDKSNGSYIMSHRISFDTMDRTITHVKTPDLSALAKARSQLSKLSIGYNFNSIILSNIIPWAKEVEQGGPTWRRPGYAVYTKTLAKARQFLIRRLK